MNILPLDPELVSYLKKHNLTTKFKKQIAIFQKNPRHPSLHNELLEPKKYGIRSFRIDQVYRALFVYNPIDDSIEIIDINRHYK